jgi:trehalose 6-phosphate synthase
MAACLEPLLRPDDVNWVHDYRLIPIGAELRRNGVGAASSLALPGARG